MDAKTVELRVNRKALTVTDLHETDDARYWWSRSPAERLAAIEINRRIVYGYGDTPPRLQRVLEVVER